jgi:uncharacterized protein (DUF305 family)
MLAVGSFSAADLTPRERLTRYAGAGPRGLVAGTPEIALKRRRPPLVTIIVGVVTAAALAGCAAGDTDSSGAAATNAERAFLEAMIPHHQSAIKMARVAKRRAEHRQIRELAEAIIAAQSNEIRDIRRIHRRLFGEKVLPNVDGHQGLGLSAAEAGMAHDDPTAKLARARRFDRAFIDEMIRHHQGAIRMARAVRGQTDSAELRSLANAIVSAQAEEIEQMNRWRTAWYGAPSPSGNVPEEASGPGDSGEEHEGGHTS